jgi:hypothetical protein
MRNRGALVVGCRQIGVLFIASTLVIGGLSQSFGAISYTDTADAEFGGPMAVTGFSGSYSTGLYTDYLTITNTGGQTLPDIQLAIPFVWANELSPGNEQAMTWNTSSGTWTRVSPAYNFSFSSYMIGAGSSTAPVLFPMSSSDMPTSSAAPMGGETATVLASDLVPDMDLGAFSAGQSKVLTLNFPSNIPTDVRADLGAYFLEPVPEPSTFALLAAGGAGLLGCIWRRRRIA